MPHEIRVRVVEMPEQETPEEPIRPSVNAMLLLAVILLGSMWTWFYSEWFAVVSGALGFAVLLGAVPTLRSYMSSERNKQWNAKIDAFLFKSKASTVVYIILLLAIVVGGFGFCQPIAIHAAETAPSTAVTVKLYSAADSDPSVVRLKLEPGKTKRWPVLWPFLGGPDRMVVNASALPLLDRDLSGLPWKQIAYPLDFWSSPALLLYPAPAILAELREKTHHLQITRTVGNVSEQPCMVQNDYLGEPVWLGTGGRTLPVSAGTQTKWREQAELYGIRNGKDELATFVIGSALAPTCLETLAPYDRIDWVLKGSGGSTLYSGSVTIAADQTYPIERAMENAP